MEWELTSVSEAKVRLHELVGRVGARPIVLLRRSRPEAVLVSYESWVEAQRTLEDLRDRLAVYKSMSGAPDVRLSQEKLMAELGLVAEDKVT